MYDSPASRSASPMQCPECEPCCRRRRGLPLVWRPRRTGRAGLDVIAFRTLRGDRFQYRIERCLAAVGWVPSTSRTSSARPRRAIRSCPSSEYAQMGRLPARGAHRRRLSHPHIVPLIRSVRCRACLFRDGYIAGGARSRLKRQGPFRRKRRHTARGDL